MLRGNLIVFTSAQESIVWEEHILGLAQAILVVWQSDCDYLCTRIDCLGTAPPCSSTSNPCCVAI
jgi:hypothetical protein